jgi:hypothetical protein
VRKVHSRAHGTSWGWTVLEVQDVERLFARTLFKGRLRGESKSRRASDLTSITGTFGKQRVSQEIRVLVP